LFASADPLAWKARVTIEEELAQLARQLGDVEASLRHSRAAVALGEEAMARESDPEPLLSARIGLGMSLFATDPQAAKAMFEDVLEALPRHGLQDTLHHHRSEEHTSELQSR